jgi:DNA-binding GntR family transcriptional regulator
MYVYGDNLFFLFDEDTKFIKYKISNPSQEGPPMLSPLGVKRSSVAQKVYEQMKQLILLHEVEPGEKIGLVDLATRLEVSLTPLREALTRLKEEGFVVHYTHRGYFVAEISAQEALDLYGVREALESYALAMGAPHVEEGDLKTIADAIEDHRKATTKRDGFLEDKVLHLRLASIANNQLLARVLEQVLDRAIMKLRVGSLPRQRGPEAYEEHRDILAALRQRDAEQAVKHLKRHLERTRAYVLTFLAQQQGKPK